MLVRGNENRDEYQFSSLKHVMVAPRAKGSVDDVWFFEGICLNDNSISRRASPEWSAQAQLQSLLKKISLQLSTEN